MRMKQRARFAALVALIFGTATLVAALLGCSSQRIRPVFYLSQPVTNDSISVYFGDREVIWLDEAMRQARSDMQEGGVCLHVARAVGDTAFYVDSIEYAAPLFYQLLPNWKHVQFMCPPETAPLHWHVVTPAWHDALQEIGYGGIETVRCQWGPADTARYWSRYPFVAVQCGMGADSIHVRKVRPR